MYLSNSDSYYREKLRMYQVEREKILDIVKSHDKQICELVIELNQLRPKPAKFRVGQVLIKLDNNAFTVRAINKLDDGSYTYTNSRNNSPYQHTFIPEADLRELNDIELGKY